MSKNSSKNKPNSPKNHPKFPEAYKHKKQDFYGREFAVNMGVLIPRPETEMLVDMVLNLVGKSYLEGVKPSEPKLPQDLTILDVGTGSGCIAITLKLELPESTVYAVDISEQAMRAAKRNAKLHGVDKKVKIFLSYLMKNPVFRPEIAKKIQADFHRNNVPVRIPDLSKIDIVVANLPYLDEDWDWLDKEALGFEPKVALYAENHGLALIYEMIDQAEECNVPYLALEADPCQHEKIIDYAKTKNFEAEETRGYAILLKRAR